MSVHTLKRFGNGIYDIPKPVLPCLQALRQGKSTRNICLVLATFKVKEPEFAARAIDYLVSAYKTLPETHPCFERPERMRSKKRPVSSALPNQSATKRRRTSSASQPSSKKLNKDPPTTSAPSSARPPSRPTSRVGHIGLKKYFRNDAQSHSTNRNGNQTPSAPQSSATTSPSDANNSYEAFKVIY